MQSHTPPLKLWKLWESAPTAWPGRDTHPRRNCGNDGSHSPADAGTHTPVETVEVAEVCAIGPAEWNHLDPPSGATAILRPPFETRQATRNRQEYQNLTH